MFSRFKEVVCLWAPGVAYLIGCTYNMYEWLFTPWGTWLGMVKDNLMWAAICLVAAIMVWAPLRAVEYIVSGPRS
jgi:hypothetical protein